MFLVSSGRTIHLFLWIGLRWCLVWVNFRFGIAWVNLNQSAYVGGVLNWQYGDGVIELVMFRTVGATFVRFLSVACAYGMSLG